MKERAILFSAPMVRALLSGQKTQTRRAVKPQPKIEHWQDPYMMSPKNERARFRPVAPDWPDSEDDDVYCPYGQPGDRLWVREAWRMYPMAGNDGAAGVIYRADEDMAGLGPWKPSIHMFRRDSRITLEVTGVHVERLQDISEEDAKAEGTDCLIAVSCTAAERALLDLPLMENGNPYRNGFALLWESINGDGSWAANSWVWVVEFKRIKP